MTFICLHMVIVLKDSWRLEADLMHTDNNIIYNLQKTVEIPEALQLYVMQLTNHRVQTLWFTVHAHAFFDAHAPNSKLKP